MRRILSGCVAEAGVERSVSRPWAMEENPSYTGGQNRLPEDCDRKMMRQPAGATAGLMWKVVRRSRALRVRECSSVTVGECWDPCNENGKLHQCRDFGARGGASHHLRTWLLSSCLLSRWIFSCCGTMMEHHFVQLFSLTMVHGGWQNGGELTKALGLAPCYVQNLSTTGGAGLLTKASSYSWLKWRDCLASNRIKTGRTGSSEQWKIIVSISFTATSI